MEKKIKITSRFYGDGSPDGVIISGFPGVGKSKAFEYWVDDYNGMHIEDSDSSKFQKDQFPDNYIAHIQNIISHNSLVFVSSHKTVREALKRAGMPFVLVYPHRKLLGEYIQRYIDRGSPASFIRLLFENLETWVTECENETCEKIELEKGQYVSNILEHGEYNFRKTVKQLNP